MSRRAYQNDRIYRIIGGWLSCERKVENGVEIWVTRSIAQRTAAAKEPSQ